MTELAAKTERMGHTMKAIVRDAYGSVDVLRLGDIAKPVAGER